MNDLKLLNDLRLSEVEYFEKGAYLNVCTPVICVHSFYRSPRHPLLSEGMCLCRPRGTLPSLNYTPRETAFLRVCKCLSERTGVTL